MASSAEVYIAPSASEVKDSHHIRIFIEPEVHERIAQPLPCPHTTAAIDAAIEMALGKRRMQGTTFMSSDLSLTPLPLPPKNEYILYITNKGAPCVRFFVDREKLLKDISLAIELPLV